jgi:hypothetical protein
LIARHIATNGRSPTNPAFIPAEAAIAITEAEKSSIEKIAVGTVGLELH